MRKGRGRSKCFLYSMKYREPKKKKKIFLSNWEFFVWNWEKTILFGIGNGAEFRPQNRVIESPDVHPCSLISVFVIHYLKTKVTSLGALGRISLNSPFFGGLQHD